MEGAAPTGTLLAKPQIIAVLIAQQGNGSAGEVT
jgi:hypothetical protein